MLVLEVGFDPLRGVSSMKALIAPGRCAARHYASERGRENAVAVLRNEIDIDDLLSVLPERRSGEGVDARIAAGFARTSHSPSAIL